MNREMIRKVVEEAVRTGDVEVVLQIIDNMESVAHKALGELKETCIEITKTRLMEQKEEFKDLLSDLKLMIENDIATVIEDGVTREITLEDKLELIEEAWLTFKENLLEHLDVNLYDKNL